MLAAFTGQPILQIDQKEARLLAEGIVAVQSQYPNVLMSDKQQAWFLFAMACATVYGPRLWMLRSQATAKKAANVPTPSNVVKMPLG
jgi:hypothetical protein